MGKYLVSHRKLKRLMPKICLSKDISIALHHKIIILLKEAVVRARANKRKTVQARDI